MVDSDSLPVYLDIKMCLNIVWICFISCEYAVSYCQSCEITLYWQTFKNRPMWREKKRQGNFFWMDFYLHTRIKNLLKRYQMYIGHGLYLWNGYMGRIQVHCLLFLLLFILLRTWVNKQDDFSVSMRWMCDQYTVFCVNLLYFYSIIIWLIGGGDLLFHTMGPLLYTLLYNVLLLLINSLLSFFKHFSVQYFFSNLHSHSCILF